MAGYLGADFDPTQPEDSDSVKFGAAWIRDFKRRVKLFASTLFNLETGQLRDRVVRHASLVDMAGLTPGTYNRVRVNSKGLVEFGENSSEQQVASLYTACFFGGDGGYTIERQGQSSLSGTGHDSIFLQGPVPYLGAGQSTTIPPFENLYPVNGHYCEYVWTPPAGVRRVRAIIIGGGGGAYLKDGDEYNGGAGGMMTEAIFPLDGTGQQALSIIVGDGGLIGSATVDNSGQRDGVPSRVALGASVYVESAGGKGATSSAYGEILGAYHAGNLLVIRSAGTNGSLNVSGLSGSSLSEYGRGAGRGINAGSGAVFLQWIQ